MTKFILPLLLASTAIGTAFAQSAKSVPAQAVSGKTQYNAPFTDPANVRADLARIDASMNATFSFQGDFRQVAPNGAVSQGKIWLQRPGKVRFEYDNLAEDTEVIALQKLPGQWIVTARDGSGQQEGAITLVFDSETLALQTWIIADDFGGATRVSLSNLQYNSRIDPKKFILREENRRRRRQ